MAAPIVYKSTDANAPTLDGQKGSLIAVLKACLVNGYTGKSAAGWTIATEDAPNNKIIFRNDSVNGSGLYFRVQDNGRVASGPTSYHTTDRPAVAALCGMNSYVDINTPVVPFPRVITGGNLISNYAYGVVVRKTQTITNPTYKKPWIVIADSRTCWIITFSTTTDSTTLPTQRVDQSDTSLVMLSGFGDLYMFNPASTISPKAFVFAGEVDTTDVYTSGGSAGLVNSVSVGYPEASLSTRMYLNRSLESASFGVSAFLVGQRFTQDTYHFGGRCIGTPSVGTYKNFYSDTIGTDLNPIIVKENLDDAARTFRTSSVYAMGGEVGALPGFFGCPHTTASVTYRIGDEYTEKTQDGDSYMLLSFLRRMPTTGNAVSSLFAIKLSDWWA